MEMAVAIVIITVVMIVAVCFGRRLIPMVQTIDALSLASAPAYNEIVYHAAHGRWPPPDDSTIVGGNNKGSFVNQLTLGEDGVITAQLAIGPGSVFSAATSAADAETIRGSLSFRPQLLGSRDAPTVTLLCGHARPIAGQAAPSGTDLTTLHKQVLPPFCR
jgi:hypothetical protein